MEVSREVLQLGLALHDAANEERMYDIADTAASLIIEHCDETDDGDLIIQLETRLSAREKTPRLKELINLTARSKKSCDGQLRSLVFRFRIEKHCSVVTGLTAAVLSGDAVSLSETLRDLGMS